MDIAENLLDQNGIHAEEAMLFREWWLRLHQGYPDIPATVLAASLGRVFCEKMRVERDDKPDVPGETIFFFAEPDWESLDYILNWLRLSVRENAAWLQDVDASGRPRRLLFAPLFIDLEREADRDTDAGCVELAKTLNENDEMTVGDFDGGYRVVRLLTNKAVDLEAGRMRHYVGQGEDRDRFESGEEAYYSLRRPDGFPVATLEVELPAEGPGILMHIAGHRNSSASDEYLAILLPWLERQGWDGVDVHCGLMDEPEPIHMVWKAGRG
ncbi:hypothetical protein CQ054_10685 [Ochrobactrum sp. MYb29]|nr:hypothetical protein CQ054_10685 [Ochrobactrum sp. MYb29]